MPEGNFMDAILFDVGGVLVEYSEHKHTEYLAEMMRKRKRIDVKQVYTTIEKYLDKFERGMISKEMFVKETTSKLGISDRELDWCGYFRKHATPNPETIEIAKELKSKGYIVGLLSNIDKCRYAYLSRLLDFDMFDYRFASCNIGFRKPDKRIYVEAARRMKVKVGDILFIDNMKSNVEGALAAGMHSLLFKSARDLKTKLLRLEI